MVTLSSCLIWQIITFILPPNEYGFVYAWTTLGSGLAIDADFGKKKKKEHHFRWSSSWSWRVCKQVNLAHIGHRKPARIHCKADASKTSHCSVRILVQKHNWGIFHRKRTRRGHYSQWRSLSGHVKRIFVYKNWRGGFLATFGFNRTTLCATQPKLDSMFCVFEDHIISSRADVVWPPRSCDFTPLWGIVKDKCYAYKPETIDALKDNIREAIAEIQLHTMDNALKN